MRLIRDIESAKSTLLQRLPLERIEVSLSARERIKASFGEELSPEEAVGRIIEEVRTKGDEALFHYSQIIDGVELTQLEVAREEITEAYKAVDAELIQALNSAAERVRSFHRRQMPASLFDFEEGMGALIHPLQRVGVYAPGGYPSSVLMTAIPAKVAGVAEVVLTTPPGRGGVVPPATLVAADIAEVERIFKLGGAQAIAAMALGTESVPKVDKLCGAGNVFVTLAKKMLYGTVAIDGLYGPTETMLIADEGANPKFIAADLLAQAEHDEMASAILITTSPELAQRVDEELESQLAQLERSGIARASLEQNGGIVIVETVEQAIELANFYAPEHLCLMVQDPWSYVAKLRHAGGIFINSPETLGDYIAGPSHVMPTGGTARFSSPLSVFDFLKLTSIVALDDEAIKSLGSAAATIARAEGLTAHAKAVEMRLEPHRE